MNKDYKGTLEFIANAGVTKGLLLLAAADRERAWLYIGALVTFWVYQLSKQLIDKL